MRNGIHHVDLRQDGKCNQCLAVILDEWEHASIEDRHRRCTRNDPSYLRTTIPPQDGGWRKETTTRGEDTFTRGALSRFTPRLHLFGV